MATKRAIAIGAAIAGVAIGIGLVVYVLKKRKSVFVHWGYKHQKKMPCKRTTTPIDLNVVEVAGKVTLRIPKLNLMETTPQLFKEGDIEWSAIYNHKLPKPTHPVKLLLPVVRGATNVSKQCTVLLIDADGTLKLVSMPQVQGDDKRYYCDLNGHASHPIQGGGLFQLPQDFSITYNKAVSGRKY